MGLNGKLDGVEVKGGTVVSWATGDEDTFPLSGRVYSVNYFTSLSAQPVLILGTSHG